MQDEIKPRKAGPKPSGARAAKPTPPETPTADKPGERIAKTLSRAGVASRREAERMIEAGLVAVNGKVISSPALNVTAKDRITVEGKPVAAAEPARLWLYYKPDGLVTSNSDEKGRETMFDYLPEDLPRVMTVGRLDLNSEGLLLLTNDGELKRRLELPSTGWLRKYRVRIKGNPTDPELEPLRKGIEVEGERFQPMIVILDRIQGANAWLTIGLREGKNREIRRAMNAINLTVNRLIRISYGPFRLGDLEPGEVSEVRGKVLRDQLGFDPATDEVPEPRRAPTRRLAPKTGPNAGRNAGPNSGPNAGRREDDAPRVIPTRGPIERRVEPVALAADAPRGKKPAGWAKATPARKAGATPTTRDRSGPKPGQKPGAKPGPRKPR